MHPHHTTCNRTKISRKRLPRRWEGFIMPSALAVLLALAWMWSGCESTESNETELISRVELTFTPTEGGTLVVASFSDPDGDGGVSGTKDPIVLTLETQYTLEIRLLNELADPVEDVTADIRDEAEDHLFLIAGDGVQGPASNSGAALVMHMYADRESDYTTNAVGDDLPVGLSNTITAVRAGDAKFVVMLRHLPEQNGEPQKTADLPQRFANGDALAGNVDVDVTFELSVR